ncbi:MAG: hypothetical protein KKA07_09990 [Bacteroidetes bacterium]|nr:hypothetical protein [Bacteroidota bacterium]
MPNGKDLELLERFTSALDKSGKIGVTEIGPDAKVMLHVMPDRVIEVIRVRINELIRRRDGISSNVICYKSNITTWEDYLSLINDKSSLNAKQYRDKISMSESCIATELPEIEELTQLIERYEQLILRFLEVCIDGAR